MGHHISAMITAQPVDNLAARELKLPVLQEGTFTIVPLDALHSDHWAQELGIPYEHYSSMVHDSKVTLEFAKRLGVTEFTIVETEYFGGVGSQAAAVYLHGNRALLLEMNQPSNLSEVGKINQALSMIGVVAIGIDDEFDTVGLGKYRSFWDLFSEYNDD